MPTNNPSQSGLSKAAIAGIVVGSVVGSLLLLGLVFWILARIRRRRRRERVTDMMAPVRPDPYGRHDAYGSGEVYTGYEDDGIVAPMMSGRNF